MSLKEIHPSQNLISKLIMRSTIIILGFLFFVINVRSQEKLVEEPIISNSTYRILYFGYDYKIKIGNNVGRKSYQIEGKNINIQQDSINSNEYHISPAGFDSGEIYFIDNQTKDTFSIRKFEFLSMPAPKLYLGQSSDGEFAKSRVSDELSAKYDELIDLPNARFEIDKWIVSIAGSEKTFSGLGNKLSEDALYAIQNASKGSLLTISCIYRGTGTGGRPVSAVIKL